MVDIGDTFEHAEHGRVEVLDFEKKMVMSRNMSADGSITVKFIRLEDELARENIREQELEKFEKMTKNWNPYN